jgi:hypothetical protein
LTHLSAATRVRALCVVVFDDSVVVLTADLRLISFPLQRFAPMCHRWSTIALCCALTLIGVGCRLIDRKPMGSPLLTPTEMSEDGVTLQIFFARCPVGDEGLNGPLWNDLDEQELPAPLRRSLSANGFRAGLVGMQAPASLSRLLDLSQESSSPASDGKPVGDGPPAVSLKALHVRPGKLSELVISGSYAKLPVLLSDEGQVQGKTYYDAQGLFAMKVYPQGDGRVRLEIIPELQHGEAKTRYIGDDGMFRLDASRPKQSFEKLTVEMPLSPGQMLVLTCHPDRPGSLGYQFFTEALSDRVEQKLLVIRLTPRKYDDLFSRPKDTASTEP